MIKTQLIVFKFQFSSLFFLICLLFPNLIFAQLDAGPDVTINPGVPVTLTAKYGEDMIAIPVPMGDDEVKGPFDFDPSGDFQFTFYNNQYSAFSVASNGWISFTHQPSWGGTRQAFRIPNNRDYNPKNCILGPMQDFNPALSQSPYIYYKTMGMKPNRKLVVMWCQVPVTKCETEMATFQIILDEANHTIENHVYSKPACSDPSNDKATAGIQNEFGTIGLSAPYYNLSPLPLIRQAWKYTPDATAAEGYVVTSTTFELQPITPEDKILYSWYEGSNPESFSNDKSIVVTPNETTIYTVVCNICSGATFTDVVTVFVEPKIPDTFTPNGDATNETFEIVGLPVESITLYNIKIYNRWGQMVFTETEIMNPWNGKMNNTGELCPDGTYVWVIYYEMNSGKDKVTNKGTVTLLR